MIGGIEVLRQTGIAIDVIAGSVTDSQMGEDFVENQIGSTPEMRGATECTLFELFQDSKIERTRACETAKLASLHMKIRTAIFGGSGYGGSELLRILLFHPNVEITLVTANEHAGKAVGDVHRNLLGLTDLEFEPAPDDLSNLRNMDVAFFALPHGQALTLIPQLPRM